MFVRKVLSFVVATMCATGIAHANRTPPVTVRMTPTEVVQFSAPPQNQLLVVRESGTSISVLCPKTVSILVVGELHEYYCGTIDEYNFLGAVKVPRKVSILLEARPNNVYIVDPEKNNLAMVKYSGSGIKLAKNKKPTSSERRTK